MFEIHKNNIYDEIFYFKPHLDTSLYKNNKITESKIKLEFIEIFTQMIIFCNLFLAW